jgi:hypothetical protein
MLRFFRQIRQRLLTENKFSKYLLYAIGEILLVVIGILIALYIDGRQSEHQENIRSQNLLRNIQSDLEQDTTNLQELAEMYEKIHRDRLELLRRNELEDFQVDSLMHLVMPFFRIVHLTDQSFQKIKNTGVTELTGFEDIYDKINKYYTSDNEFYIQRINWDSELSLKEAEFWYYTKDFEHFYYEVFFKDSIPSKQSQEQRKGKLIKMLDDIEVRNMLRTSAFRKRFVVESVLLTKSKATQLLSNIEEVLKESD